MKLLFNPFEKYRENQLLIFGCIITLVGAALGYFFNARFDGMLDLHFVEIVRTYTPLVDILIDIFCATIVFFIAGYLINNKTRAIDMLAMVVLARIPIYFLTFFNANGRMFLIGEKMVENLKPDPLKALEASELALMICFGIVSILFMIWHIALLYNGFRISSNGRGGKAVLFFILSIIVGEVISKLLIGSLPL